MNPRGDENCGVRNIPMRCHTDRSVVKEKKEGIGPGRMGRRRNALRHHCERKRNFDPLRPYLPQCSTPSGITHYIEPQTPRQSFDLVGTALLATH